ncbi:hypothetical protein TUM4261_42710 [Shewanella sp. c952]|uniref:helix-turn-helix transcriptional regulator n=1 Tax=Shewanella sp. c952 TaxID=2815913 RepID=UPI001BBE4254|nr:hypothetical protein [Shewanella sp. c952]GIU20063.1 hypothetical protein TUM4261_42710 [Shewanella sp. c952]
MNNSNAWLPKHLEQENVNQIDYCKLISPKKMSKLLGIHRTTLDRWVKNGELPEPIRENGRAKGWKYSDYIEWLTIKSKTTLRVNQLH